MDQERERERDIKIKPLIRFKAKEDEAKQYLCKILYSLCFFASRLFHFLLATNTVPARSFVMIQIPCPKMSTCMTHEGLMLMALSLHDMLVRIHKLCSSDGRMDIILHLQPASVLIHP